MDCKNLKWFQEVCHCKSITKAAANLFITPQGLSKGIRNLEAELGVVLLERTPNGVSLTDYGECVFQYADAILANYQEMTGEIKKMKQQERGLLRICSSYGVFRIMGPDFIMDFEKNNPGMTVDYMEYPDRYIENEILSCNYDVGFAIAPIIEPGLEIIPLFSSPVSLLVYQEHPLAQRESVTFADLKDEPLILESSAFKIHDLVKESCLKAGFEANVIYCTSGFSLCHTLTAQKRGISVIVNRISTDMSTRNLKAIPIKDSFIWEVNLICKDKYKNSTHIQKCKAYTYQYLKEKGIAKIPYGNSVYANR